MRHIATSAFGLFAAASFVGIAHADTQRVGVTSAVNPSAAGTPPGAATRQLIIGGDVVFRERVITTDEGQAQILFLDQSALMIGPNSTVVIDEFVYDPGTSKGNIAATLTQGSFRYIGGKLSKQGNATLKTPVATIGIRGSDVTVTFDAARNQAEVVTTHGSANIQTLGGVLGLRTGFSAIVGSLDRPPGQAIALTAAQIAAANKIFEGQPGKIAGAQNLPTNERVANSQLSSTVEAQRLAATETAAGGNSDQPPVLPDMPPPRPEDNGASFTVSPSQTSSAGSSSIDTGSRSASITRSNRALNGFVAGFARIRDDDGRSREIVTNELPSDVTIRTIPDPSGPGRVLATFNFRGVDVEALEGAGIEMGDRPGARPATRSVFLDDRTLFASQKARARLNKGQIEGTPARAEGTMISIGAIDDNGQRPESVLCECLFVEWGVWDAKLSAPSAEEHLRVKAGLWVTGVLPNVSDPAPQGVATFNGTAVGFVRNQGRDYAASGAFQNQYNFSQRSGNVTISNFDGRTFGGQVKAGSDWRSYSGSLAGSNLAGNVNGAFYGNRDAAGQLQVPKETAGNFNVGGARYSATGIFAGSR